MRTALSQPFYIFLVIVNTYTFSAKIDKRFGNTDHYPIKQAQDLPEENQGDNG